MPGVTFSPALRKEYEQLFNTCSVRPDRTSRVDPIVDGLLANRSRYQAVAGAVGIPWYFIAAVHNMESDCRFDRHLHNGDPLTARTRQVPAGRPRTGSPPFTWEESARDALSLRSLSASTDWSLAGTLYQLEGYNGWGYRRFHAHVLSPYLWSFSNHYTSGKYVSDGTWSDSAVSKQCGAAVLLRRMAERGDIQFPDQPTPGPGVTPMVTYSTRKPADPAALERAIQLQRWLNTHPGIWVREDGVAGERTSDAYRRVMGSYLPGDPRR